MAVEERNISKREAVQRQIHAAIKLLDEEEYECAITLAHAAEGMMAGGEEVHLFARLRADVPPEIGDEKRWVNMLNETAHWLKHATPNLPDLRRVSRFLTAIMVMRAVSKYFFTFKEETEAMYKFSDTWVASKGFMT